MAELTRGSDAIYNCANPQYHRWPTDWPPIASALLAAAQANDAVLAITGNLYAYGPVDRPMTEDLPLASSGTKGRVRARMWQDALAAHQAGRVRAVECRGSDYLGVGAQSLLSLAIVPRLAQRKTAYVPAPLDVRRSWTDVTDMARMLVTAATDPRAWGRAWHAPSAEPATIRHLTELAAARIGVVAKVREIPWPAIRAAGLVNPFARELRETRYQFDRPFILDSSAAQQTFGLEPTSLTESISRIVDSRSVSA